LLSSLSSLSSSKLVLAKIGVVGMEVTTPASTRPSPMVSTTIVICVFI
jgi:hypothetical protein